MGTSYCGPAVANSSGRSGRIRVSGLDSASANEVFLTADQLPDVQSASVGYFLVSRTQGHLRSSQPLEVRQQLSQVIGDLANELGLLIALGGGGGDADRRFVDVEAYVGGESLY